MKLTDLILSLQSLETKYGDLDVLLATANIEHPIKNVQHLAAKAQIAHSGALNAVGEFEWAKERIVITT